MKFEPFSLKQEKTLAWWMEGSRWSGCDAIIADGAVRSGKSICLSMSFILWAMSNFDEQQFAICGKTVLSCRRNIITPILQIIRGAYKCQVTESVSQGFFDVSNGKAKNRFFIFGGKDERSAALIQGVTLAGILFDEVALMPKSFVEQALARCSVEGSKFWFSCNPESPSHWFYTEWISRLKSKNAYYLHFTMDDNPSMSDKIKARYRTLYSGVFYDRYVLGKWVIASGIVYPMFSQNVNTFGDELQFGHELYYVSIDYGTQNPFSMSLWAVRAVEGVWKAYKLKEYYYCGRDKNRLKTDQEYYDDMIDFLTYEDEEGEEQLYIIQSIVVDPSASSFIELIRRHGRFSVRKAYNKVMNGIRFVSSLLVQRKLMFHESCANTFREFGLYSFNEKSTEDDVIKENDHAMDDMRYFVSTIFMPEYERSEPSWAKIGKY